MTDQQLDDLVARIGDEMLTRLGLSSLDPVAALAGSSCGCDVPVQAPASVSRTRPVNWSSRMIEWDCRDGRSTVDQVRARCRQARSWKLGAVGVLPNHVTLASQTLRGSEVRVAAAVGWPHGATSTSAKALETELALGQGADSIEVVVPIGALLAGDDDLVFGELKFLADMVHRAGKAITAVIETPVLEEARLVAACALARLAGADAMGAAAGLTGHGAASADAVRLFRRIAGDDLVVKAGGGVSSEFAALALAAAGADSVTVDDFAAAAALAASGSAS